MGSKAVPHLLKYVENMLLHTAQHRLVEGGGLLPIGACHKRLATPRSALYLGTVLMWILIEDDVENEVAVEQGLLQI